MIYPKISIIYQIYNFENFLKSNLENILNQSFKDFELICVNDCSCDFSIKILEEFAKKDSRVKILNNDKHIGASYSKNIGLDYANGDYIFFLNNNENVSNYILEKLYNNINKTGADIVISDNVPFYSYQVCLENFTETMNCNLFESAKLYSKDFIMKNNIRFIQKDNNYEEQNFLIKSLSAFPKISFINDSKFINKLSEDEISKNILSNNYKEMIINLEDIFNYIKQNKKISEAEKLIYIIKSSEIFKKYFEMSICFFIKYKFSENEKYVRIFGIDLFKVKIKKDIKQYRILGIPLFKSKILPFEKINYEQYNAELIKDYSSAFKTKNTNPEIEKELTALGKFYFVSFPGNLGDSVICSSEYQYFRAKNFEYSVYEFEKPLMRPYCVVLTGGVFSIGYIAVFIIE